MLMYKNIINDTIYTRPYNMAAIDSDSTNVAIYVNDKLQEIVSPNVGKAGELFNTYKHSLTDQQIVDLLYSGTLEEYTNDENKLIFGPTNVVYIKNELNEFLYREPVTGSVSWSSSLKSRFFFNPRYFDSKYLWVKVFKKFPDNIYVTHLWDVEEEVKLFNQMTVSVTGVNLPSLVKPHIFSYFNTTGQVDSINLVRDIVIKGELGDRISLKTDKEKLDFTYDVSEVSQMLVPNISGSTTSRPLISIPIKTLNPNSEWTYSKILNHGVNNFDITISVENKIFTSNMVITRV